jgi:hypothetical protein
MEDKLEIQVLTSDSTSETRTVFMSYGLLNSLTGLIGDPDRAVMLETDPELCSTIVTAVFVPRTPSGKINVKLEDYDPPGLTTTEAEKLFDWVKGHVVDFFTRRLRSSLKLMEDRKDELKAIGSSLVGLSPAPSKT